MERPAPSAEERYTSLSFKLPGHPTTRAYSFVVASAATHEAWIGTSRASCGSDFGSLGLMNKEGGSCMLLRQLRTYIERTRQKRKALHMLALSGVVRPSHVELRYAIPLLNLEDHLSALHDKPLTAVRPSNRLQKFFELVSWSTKNARSFGHLLSDTWLRLRKSVSTSVSSSH
jgi:hypothetical protein